MTTLPTPRRVVVGAGAHAALVERLRGHRPHLEFRGAPYTAVTADDLAWGDTYVGFKRPPLATVGSVRWVHCTGAGVDAWLEPARGQDPLPDALLLTRTSESFGPAIAEWALARALAVKQELLDLAECQLQRRWAGRDIATVRGTRAVVVGTGDVGTHVARLFTAVGAEVLGVSRSGGGDPAAFAWTAPASELRRVVPDADWLIVTLPLTPETRGLIGRDVLSACRGAYLMNAGRGAVVDEVLLPEALDRGWLRGAALDVFSVEPLPTDSPLWGDRRVMISPHISGPTTIDGAVDGFMECLTELERGERPARAVDRARGY